MKATRQMSRREALAAGTGLGLTILPSRVLGLQGQTPPSERLNLAFIGLGTYGTRELKELASQNIVALCDVDWRPRSQVTGAAGTQQIASEVIQQYPGVKRFDDWRIMLQEMDKQIDGVVVASADHTHAIAAITAMKMGKHVYCEKPLAQSVDDVRAMMAAGRKCRVSTQMGIQGHASEDCRAIVEWIRDGAIGTVREVHLFQIARLTGYYYDTVEEEAEALKHVHDEVPVPADVKWDLFLGPAPHRPYNPMYLPRRWRSWLDFGGGILGDHGPHYVDPVFWALDLGYPETIEAETNPEWDPRRDTQMYPDSATVRYLFPARERRPAVHLTWHGFRTPPVPKGWNAGEKLPDGGGIVVGTKGSIVYGPMYQGRPRETVPGLVKLVPEALDKGYRRPDKTLPRPRSHWLEWVEAAKGGKPADASFAYAGKVTEFALLGDIAIRHKGTILRFDAGTQKFTNSDTANQMFGRPNREGWKLPV